MALIGRVWLSPPMIGGLARELGVHRTTVARWIRCGRVPPAVEHYLDLKHNGHLGAISNAWDGWKLCARTGELVTPTGDVLRPGHVLSMPYQLHLVSALRQRVRELERHRPNETRNARHTAPGMS